MVEHELPLHRFSIDIYQNQQARVALNIGVNLLSMRIEPQVAQ